MTTYHHPHHFAAWARIAGHDPADILRRCKQHGSLTHDQAAWGVIREYYDTYSRMSYEMVAAVTGLPVGKVQSGLRVGYQYNLAE